jgi:hypothetical protein
MERTVFSSRRPSVLHYSCPTCDAPDGKLCREDGASWSEVRIVDMDGHTKMIHESRWKRYRDANG